MLFGGHRKAVQYGHRATQRSLKLDRRLVVVFVLVELVASMLRIGRRVGHFVAGWQSELFAFSAALLPQLPGDARTGVYLAEQLVAVAVVGEGATLLFDFRDIHLTGRSTGQHTQQTRIHLLIQLQLVGIAHVWHRLHDQLFTNRHTIVFCLDDGRLLPVVWIAK